MSIDHGDRAMKRFHIYVVTANDDGTTYVSSAGMFRAENSQDAVNRFREQQLECFGHRYAVPDVHAVYELVKTDDWQ